MSFNFNRARVKCPKLGKKTHVAKALLTMKDREGITGAELEVLSKGVDYIKQLEAEVSRLQSIPVEHRPVVVNVVGPEVNGTVPAGLLGRLFSTARGAL